MSTAFVFFSGAACSLLVLASTKLAVSYCHQTAGRWLLVLLVGVFFYLLRNVLPPLHPLPHFLMEIPAILIPGAFWLFAHSLCAESHTFPRWGWTLIAAEIAINIASLDYLGLQGWPLPHHWLYVLAQPFKLGLIAAGLFTLLQQFQSDLVEARRRLRTALLIVMGGYMALVVYAEYLFAYQPAPAGIPTLHAVLASGLVMAACLWLLALSPGALTESLPPQAECEAVAEKQPAPTPLDEPQRQLLMQLQAHMRSGGYLHTGLTIRELAQQLGAHEYVLRALINRHLGYRNFNEFLNQFRIDEASARLADPAQAHLPVLTIALDIGYRSLSPFNAAFKRRHNLTPTEYRREHLPA